MTSWKSRSLKKKENVQIRSNWFCVMAKICQFCDFYRFLWKFRKLRYVTWLVKQPLDIHWSVSMRTFLKCQYFKISNFDSVSCGWRFNEFRLYESIRNGKNRCLQENSIDRGDFLKLLPMSTCDIRKFDKIHCTLFIKSIRCDLLCV